MRRSKALLYAFVSAREAILLDVRPHGEWASQDLVRILKRVDPNLMDRFKVKGVFGSRDEALTDSQRIALRQNGICSPIELDGSVYAPLGFGVATSRHATRLSIWVDHVLAGKEKIIEMVERNNLSDFVLRKLSSNLAVPLRLSGRLGDDGIMTIFEKSNNFVFGCARPLE